MAKDPETRQIVRAYSWQAEERLPPPNPASNLARVLTSEESSPADLAGPWRHFYEQWDLEEANRNSITADLSIEARNLQKQWIKFQAESPKEDQIDKQNTEPTLEGLIDMVKSAGRTWQAKRAKGKRGKAMLYFHRLCNNVDAHSNILEIMPKGNEYVSIFTGSITSIVKASVNHENIAEDLAKALCEISELVADCEDDLKLYKTEDMIQALADLYAHIFLFLNDTLEWYQKKRKRRVLDSFNEKFMDEFEEQINTIKRKSERIKRKAAKGAGAELRVTRFYVEETREDLRVGLEGIEREQARARRDNQFVTEQMRRIWEELQEEKKRSSRLHGQLVQFLMDSAHSHEHANAVSRLPLSQISALQLEDVTRKWKRDDLLVNSRRLEDFFHRDRVRLPCDHFTPSMADPEALACIAEWSGSDEEQVLYVAGPDFEGDDAENLTSMLAAKFIDFAANSNVRVISYFCELRRGEEFREDETREMMGLMQLIYALIRQLVELTLPEFDSNKILSFQRFENLDNSIHCWDEAVSMLSDLIDVIPGRLFVIVDGIQWIDDRSTAGYISRIPQLLKRDKLKILFTTSGQSRSLLGTIASDNLFICQQSLRRSFGSGWEFEDTMADMDMADKETD